MPIHFENTGFIERIDEIVDRIPEFNPISGDHLWCVFPVYRFNPEKTDGPALLDHESLLAIQGPGCYYCEQAYSPTLAKRRCRGHG